MGFAQERAVSDARYNLLEAERELRKLEGLPSEKWGRFHFATMASKRADVALWRGMLRCAIRSLHREGHRAEQRDIALAEAA